MPVMDAYRLDGQVAVVTGAGRGLGRAMAQALAEAGSDLALAARSVAQLEETAHLLKASGRRVLVKPTDVTDEAQVSRMAQSVLETFGRVDILVNNAGVALAKPLVEVRLEEWQQVLHTNLTSVFLCSRSFAPAMIARGRGRIINIASVDGLDGNPHVAAYAAAKGGVVNLTRAMAAEWARHGVTVNAIAPGYFETEMTSQALENPMVGERILRRIPLRRVGKPEEIGPLVVYLAGEASAFMTGEILVIDGGQHAR